MHTNRITPRDYLILLHTVLNEAPFRGRFLASTGPSEPEGSEGEAGGGGGDGSTASCAKNHGEDLQR